VDGRAARAARNRQAIVDALVDLVAERQSLPTAREVAERAGVAPRSLFHHFGDVESLIACAAETQAARHWVLLEPPDPCQPLLRRLEDAVARRAELFERIGPIRRVAVRHEQESGVLGTRLAASRAALDRHLRQVLSPEVLALGRAQAEALMALGSWETWETLRRHRRLSVRGARAAVVAGVAALMEDLEPAVGAGRLASGR
jgi:TetR/AcrR family transcriptional regulator of autoinduction and epiphytic fitness